LEPLVCQVGGGSFITINHQPIAAVKILPLLLLLLLLLPPL
jgi:hypothetical protein